MKILDLRSRLAGRRIVIPAVSLLTAAIAVTDWLVVPDISLEFLYFFPIVLAAAFLERLDIAVLALVSTLLAEQFGAAAWEPGALSRLPITFIAYGGTGVLVFEMVRRRKLTVAYDLQLASELQRRIQTEEELRGMLEGSPAAILNIDPQGNILRANQAAHALLKSPRGSLPGQPVDKYLPTLAALLETNRVRQVRTMIECTGQRSGGEVFLAHVWVSSPGPPSVSGLNAMLFDTSEQFRDREELELETVSRNARVIIGAFWHEARNLCMAMRVSVAGLKRLSGVAEAEEMEGLTSLMNSLEKLCSSELNPEAGETFDVASLRAVLDQFRIVVEPWFQDSGIAVRWRLAGELPMVRADPRNLLQIFLNVARNARRVLEDEPTREFAIDAGMEGGQVVVRFHNSGPPVSDPEELFQPYQPAALGHGMGLYVSRALARSFGGDLRYEPVPKGCCFAVVLGLRPLSTLFDEVTR